MLSPFLTSYFGLCLVLIIKAHNYILNTDKMYLYYKTHLIVVAIATALRNVTLAQLRTANNSLKVGVAPVLITGFHFMIGGDLDS